MEDGRHDGMSGTVDRLRARLELARKAALATEPRLLECDRRVTELDQQARAGAWDIDAGKAAMRELEEAQEACHVAGDRRDAIAAELEEALAAG